MISMPEVRLNSDKNNIFGYIIMRHGPNFNEFLSEEGEWTMYHHGAMIFKSYEHALEQKSFTYERGYGFPTVVELLGREV